MPTVKPGIQRHGGRRPGATGSSLPAPRACPCRRRPCRRRPFPVLLSAGKLVTLRNLYQMVLYQAGAYRHAPYDAGMGYRPASAHKSGGRAAPPAPSSLEFPAREFHLRTTLWDLVEECHCDERTLRRHLKDFETLGLVKVRRQLGVATPGAPSFYLVLNADFFDWEEVPLPGAAVPQPAPAAPEPPVPAVGAARILQRTAQLRATHSPKPGA
ncbi:hypothetical protein ACFQT0_31025 [Hymenobacter humi]|uniref:DeoR family transcriptional regulator n=1 Tax=Hymenobacter humi TaxID=1411620 RepID=A0ABW2UFY0_9BACT